MTTALLTDTVIDQLGRPVAGVTVTIRDDAGALATLTDEAGSPVANPMTTDSLGDWECWLAAGTYDVTLAKGSSSRTVTKQVAATIVEQVLVDAMEMNGQMRASATGFMLMPETFTEITPD